MVISSSVSPVDYLKEQQQEVSIESVIKCYRTFYDTAWRKYIYAHDFNSRRTIIRARMSMTFTSLFLEYHSDDDAFLA